MRVVELGLPTTTSTTPAARQVAPPMNATVETSAEVLASLPALTPSGLHAVPPRNGQLASAVENAPDDDAREPNPAEHEPRRA